MNKIQSTVAILLTGALLLSGCSSSSAQLNAPRSVTTVEAEKMDLSQILSFSSNVEGNKETVLSTKAPGQISNIDAEIGDPVSKGRLLAALTAEVDYANYNIAKIGKESTSSILETSKTLLDKKLEEARVQVLTAQENLERSKNSQSDQSTVLQEQLKNAELNYQLSKLAYENTQDILDQNEENLFDSAQSAILQTTILSKGVTAYLYSLNDNNLDEAFYLNSDFNADGEYQEYAELAIRSLKTKSDKLEEFYNQHIRGKTPSESTVSEGHELATETLQELKDALQQMNNVLSDSSPNTYVTSDDLNTYRNTILAYGTQAENLNLSAGNGGSQGLLGVAQSLESLNISRENQLQQAEKQMQIAEQNYLTLKASADAQVKDLHSQSNLMALYLAQSESALNAARAQQENQVATLQSQVKQAQGQLQLAGAMLANTKVYAPYSGVIAEKYLYEGAVVGAGTPVLKIVDISKLKLVIFVPESQVQYFKIGQKGIALSESFPGREFQTTVERISPKVEVGSKKVRVELSIADPDKILKIGMYMDLRISFDATEKVLALPLSAIQDFYGEKTVMVNEQGIAVRKTVTTGMMSENYVEILDGIAEGQQVIIGGLSTIRDGDPVQIVTEKLPSIIKLSQQWMMKIQN